VTVVETLLVYLVAPLAVVLFFVLVTQVPGARNRRRRWKPGQPWDHEPVWYVPRPEHPEDEEHDDAHLDGHGRPALTGATAASRLAIGSGDDDLPAATPGGPLGGARGTW
jgi:hypothetical protein